MVKLIELSGKRFYKFIVLERQKDLKISGITRTYWSCKCDCGNFFHARSDHILHCKIKSCGCLRKEKTGRTAYNAKPKGMAAAKAIYNGYKRNANRRNLLFTITFEDFLNISKQNCFYCGIVPSQELYGLIRNGVRKGEVRYNGNYFYNGLDKIIPEKGYVIENIRPSCWPCNQAKSSRSLQEFNEWAARFITHYGNVLNITMGRLPPKSASETAAWEPIQAPCHPAR